MQLGVCYYPEHWPETEWSSDAARMREVGISKVRLGEFAWSRYEPNPGDYHWNWLHRAIDILHAEGLEVILGTPTACPPKWLVDQHPDILATDEQGMTRGFGSRRHYCFSSEIYRQHSKRIVREMAQQFGDHPAVVAWQTDNEYGCHSTIVSYSAEAQRAFRLWCSEQFDSIEALNSAWNNIFWSMEYSNFDAIDVPNLAVTELNPAHRLAFWRFSSAQVASFNAEQVSILRKHSPGRDLMHNYMGNFCEFDHYPVADTLDVAGWDSYPLGFLDRDNENAQSRIDWLRTGHPDCAPFHHDLYRGVGQGRWWVIEQQPGAVNWAPHNPAPLAGMVKYWAMEALAHGAELCSFFRWRQHPAAQERHHTGLLLPNGEPGPAFQEVKEVAAEIASLGGVASVPKTPAPVALLFDYVGNAALETQPQGVNYDPQGWTQALYRALRRCGVDVDVLPIGRALEGYQMVILANATVDSPELTQQLINFEGTVLIGPRSFSQNVHCCTPDTLAPGSLQSLISLRVIGAESLPDAVPMAAAEYTAWRWRERVQSAIKPEALFEDGWGFHYRQGKVHYLNAQLQDDSLRRFVAHRLKEAEIVVRPCSPGLRYTQRGSLQYVFNAGPASVSIESPSGEQDLAPGEYCHWQVV